MQAEAPAATRVYLLCCRHHSHLEVYSLPSMQPVATFASLEQGAATIHARAAPSAPPRVPANCQIAEIRMDSYPPLQVGAATPLGPVPAPSMLQAPRPLLLARTRDERVFVYRLQTCAAGGAGDRDKENVATGGAGAPRLCLARHPLDWLRFARSID